MSDTAQQFDCVINVCKDIFLKKAKDYGASWRVLRTISVIDQIFIKALRIRNLQELKTQKVADDIPSEFMGIINYSVIGLIQLELKPTIDADLSANEIEKLYNEKISFAKETMLSKNHDYGEAWREMSMESFVDLIIQKLLRMKSILQNEEKLLVSEGLDANYVDILNYAAFALILLES
ncbi:hypothetical protein A9P82_07825 [Arachidicoccus ginsenosidimutans]|uniref:DUF1599 domain-containing protein n=1 Tax=Arachidicoccus sp. BS20 TaxID=1850526 RepID=UPI0007F13833|nr:DUF1599 domain-containing protein [Arachidicoccus sp. BS20]ANI89207.1 hypothetical protein A9P82_07825 [Arachidicoccus sp. BS20]